MNKLIIMLTLILVTGCDELQEFQEQANQQFSEQHFVSAVAHIELHKTRNGSYPDDLHQIRFLGDWDKIWLSSVRYEKQGSGYNLYLSGSEGSEVKLALPKEFFRGLGLKDTNVKTTSSQKAKAA